MEEIWKNVKGYEEYYQVSNYGRVKSYDRYIKCRGGKLRLMKGKFISLCNDKDGYFIFNLIKDKKRKNCKVHRLVAEHFLINDLNKPEVNHKDGNKQNNHVSNLEWATPKENMRHAVKNNLYKSGHKHHNFGHKSKRAKLVLNLQTGIFYDCMKDALFNVNLSNGQFSKMLNNKIENKTDYIYV